MFDWRWYCRSGASLPLSVWEQLGFTMTHRNLPQGLGRCFRTRLQRQTQYGNKLVSENRTLHHGTDLDMSHFRKVIRLFGTNVETICGEWSVLAMRSANNTKTEAGVVIGPEIGAEELIRPRSHTELAPELVLVPFDSNPNRLGRSDPDLEKL